MEEFHKTVDSPEIGSLVEGETSFQYWGSRGACQNYAVFVGHGQHYGLLFSPGLLRLRTGAPKFGLMSNYIPVPSFSHLLSKMASAKSLLVTLPKLRLQLLLIDTDRIVGQRKVWLNGQKLFSDSIALSFR